MMASWRQSSYWIGYFYNPPNTSRPKYLLSINRITNHYPLISLYLYQHHRPISLGHKMNKSFYWMDYFYLHWPSVSGVYTNYPLMYDRRLSNHSGRGINILLVEQTVNPASPPSPESYHGQFFGDEGAKWLQAFAKEHPELDIPMPEGLKKTR